MNHVDDAHLHIAAYNPAWPTLFEVERQLLSRALAPWLVGPIEHVGSTAVPRLPAKPVIDIMAAVESLDASRGAVGPLRDEGYQYAPYRTDVMHWFCKPSPSFRTHHLHLVPYRSRLWSERIAFRDCLRSDPAVARDYAELKSRLAGANRFDREAYTEAKGPFIARILQNLIGKAGDVNTSSAPVAVVIERLSDRPSDRLGPLVVESEQAGWRFLRRLAEEWASGRNRFDRPGEALFAALMGGRMIGVCGLNVDPYATAPRVGRVRHLYVLAAYRQLGVGRQLVAEVIEAARGPFDNLRLRTENPAAAKFYEKQGFRRCVGASDCTHLLELH